jgi:hypothetical protein
LLQLNADAKTSGSSAVGCLDDENVEERSATDDSVQLTESDGNLLHQTASLVVEAPLDHQGPIEDTPRARVEAKEQERRA